MKASASPPSGIWKKKDLPNTRNLWTAAPADFICSACFAHQQHLILIDAATDGKPLGTVSLIRPRYANDFPPTLTAHDIGLKDLIESAALLGYWPAVDLITVSIGDLGLMTMELSPEVAAALPQIETLVRSCLEKGAAITASSPVLLASK